MTQLALRLFGTPGIEVDGQQIEIGRRKAIALLVYLAVTGQPHSRDALAALLWPEADQRRARAGLRSALWALNKTSLKAWLSADAETIALRTNANVEVDVVRFQALLEEAGKHDHSSAAMCAKCVETVSAAVTLYKEEFMAGFILPDTPAFDDWRFFLAHSLQQLLVSALERLLRFHSSASNLDRATSYARRLVALDPLHEPAHHSLMKLYAQMGRQAAALRQYEVYQDILAKEVGGEPSAEITALREHIRSGEWTGRLQSAEPSPTDIPPHNLPPDPTSFIGREKELSRLAALLNDPDTRLITIIGPGGIGKTRLALATAAGELSNPSFADGIYFVSLAPITELEAMLSHIAETVDYPLQSDQRAPAKQLIDYFRQKAMLLVIDNFEHLLSSATFIADLLRYAPQLTVLATSRERLNLYGEQQFQLRGLAVPQTQKGVAGGNYASARLFIQCARRRRPDFAVEPDNLPHLATICRLVEGMPLALELAAAWTELLPLREIVAEIQHNLDFLEIGTRNVPDRHRSMRAVIDTSWQRLSEIERNVYAQLSVFRRGFTSDAAEAVAGASRKILASLASQSLLRPSPDEGRYDIHELFRQYTAVQLQKSEAGEKPAYNRHAAYYCAFLQKRHADLKGSRQHEALGEIEADLENAGAAWRWSVKQQRLGQLEQALVPLMLFYQWNGRLREGQAMCRLAVERLDQSQNHGEAAQRLHLLLKLLTWQGYFDLASANYETAEHSLQRAKTVLNSPTLRQRDTKSDKAFLLLQLSTVAKRQVFSGDALALNEESLALYRATGDAWGVAQALDGLGAMHQSLGNNELAVELLRENLAINEQLNDARGIARSYSSLGHYILFAGQLEASERYLRKSLELFRELDARAGQRNPLLVLGINLLFAGKFEASIESFEACWAIHRELGMPHEPGSANVGIARAKINLGLYEEARRLSEVDLARYRTLKDKWYIAFTLFNLGRISQAESDVAQAHQRYQDSAAMLLEMDDRPLVPDVLFCLAIVQRRLGQRQQAIKSLVRALKIAVESVPLNPMRFELPAMALLLLDAGETERAVELYAAAHQSQYIANSVWFETIAGQEIGQASAGLAPALAEAAKARGRALDLLSTAQALLAELSQ
jgi:predicted ATPase/DNA-binding SARP family transcriptional activator